MLDLHLCMLPLCATVARKGMPQSCLQPLLLTKASTQATAKPADALDLDEPSCPRARYQLAWLRVSPAPSTTPVCPCSPCSHAPRGTIG